MYFYKIGYTSYEESDYVELQHELCFTKEQITDMLADAIVALWEDVFKDKDIGDIEYPTKMQLYYFFDTYNEHNIGSWLIKNKGFLPVVYQEIFSLWGWFAFNKPETWTEETKRSITIPVIMKKLKEAGKI